MVIGMTPLTRLEALAYANATAGARRAGRSGPRPLRHLAANVIINPNTNRAHLIDVEDLYAGLQPARFMLGGTDNYAHQRAQWRVLGLMPTASAGR